MLHKYQGTVCGMGCCDFETETYCHDEGGEHDTQPLCRQVARHNTRRGKAVVRCRTAGRRVEWVVGSMEA